MNSGDYMKIKQGFSLKNINGQSVIVCDKSLNPDFNVVITLSETSVLLWNMLINGNTTKEDMLKALLARFDISTVLALNDIDVFIRTLNENGILE